MFLISRPTTSSSKPKLTSYINYYVLFSRSRCAKIPEFTLYLNVLLKIFNFLYTKMLKGVVMNRTYSEYNRLGFKYNDPDSGKIDDLRIESRITVFFIIEFQAHTTHRARIIVSRSFSGCQSVLYNE